jgi:hypothetical protein
LVTEYAFTAPGAERLASLAGLKSDLEQVERYCDRMIERYAGAHLKKSLFDIVGFTTPVDLVDWEALSIAACISYARCFVSGVRQSLDAGRLANAGAELKDTHQFILNLRNKHVAHSVNSFEENSVTVHLEDTFQSSNEIRSATPRHTRTAGLSFDMPEKLRNLAQWWLSEVRSEMSAETESVIRLAQSMPLDEIRALGPNKESSFEERRARVDKRRNQ